MSEAHDKRAHLVVVRRLRMLSFICRAHNKRTAKVLYRAFRGKAHGNGTLPCKILSCVLCRAPRQKTHGKAFAVRPRRTAKPVFPVVILERGL
jgi:hypothetical protein